MTRIPYRSNSGNLHIRWILINTLWRLACLLHGYRRIWISRLLGILLLLDRGLVTASICLIVDRDLHVRVMMIKHLHAGMGIHVV